MTNLQINGLTPYLNTNINNMKFHKNTEIPITPTKHYDIMKSLGLIGKMNMTNITFGNNKSVKTYAGHEINFTEAELDKKLEDYTTTIKLLAADAPEYKALAKGDKKALAHLVKAATILNDVFLEMDHHQNIELKKALETEAEKGDTHAQKTLKLFRGINGITGMDRMSERIFLFKNTAYSKGNNFYPNGLSEEELKNDITRKFAEDRIGDIRNIFSKRTIVRKDENGDLKGIDYVDAYPKQFQAVANELDRAAKVSTNEEFNKYLRAQAKALRKADPELDCEADRLWAKLQDTPLEFTITREDYNDKLSGTILDDMNLRQKLKKHQIEAQSKDSIGIRVGIINKKSTEYLLGFKKYLSKIAEIMPFKENYTQGIKPKGEIRQTMVDSHIVLLAGDLSFKRGGIVSAENLPNGDKLSVQRGYGRRNVYHYEIRNGGNPEISKKRLDAILTPELQKYSTAKGYYYFTIGHENAHSLGPTKGKSALGKWQSIIEEGKADMGSLFCLDHLVEQGKYTQEEKNEVIVSWAESGLLKANPNPHPELPLDEGLPEASAHRVRTVMQTNYFLEKGAIDIDKKGILHVNIEKMVPTAHAMLYDFVAIQMAKDPEKAKEFIFKYFKWTDKHEKIAENIRAIDDTLYGVLEHTLADKLLAKVKIIR